jgi:hypothetical protein
MGSGRQRPKRRAIRDPADRLTLGGGRGPQLDLPVDKLTLASGVVKKLAETHGLRGLYLRNGREFQVLRRRRTGDDYRGDVDDRRLTATGVED